MTPQFGHCKDCAAWGREIYAREVKACDRGPSVERKFPYEGCWSFIPKVEQSCKTCQMNKVSEVCGECWRGLSVYGDYWAPKKETE